MFPTLVPQTIVKVDILEMAAVNILLRKFFVTKQ